MKIETPKKVDKNSVKWEEHMNKKPMDTKGGEAEITHAKKKESVAPVKLGPPKGVRSLPKSSSDVAPAKEKVAVKTTAKEPVKTGAKKADAATEHVHIHDGHIGHSHEAPHEKHADERHEHKAKDTATKDTSRPVKNEKATKKSRKVILKQNDVASGLREKVLSQRGLPTFRGRFGKRNIRRKSIAKWNVWRVPRGIDVKKSMADGYMPRVGFATPREIRHVHPSGYRECIVRTINELSGVPKGYAIRVVSGLGSRKKMELVDRAIGMGVKVLNP